MLFLRLRCRLFLQKMAFYVCNQFKPKAYIMGIDETVTEIINEGGERKSICRFGDGEMDQILGLKEGFQKPNENLSKDLSDILSSKPENCIICVPDAINTMENLTLKSLSFWLPYMKLRRSKWMEFLATDGYKYGTTNVSRCYLRYKDKSQCGRWFNQLRGLWDNKDVVIVEGVSTRIGVGNDFLDNAKSVQRIIGPAEDAYEKKDLILDAILKKVPKDKVVVLALGPTATILAYKLSQLGYWALDVGHCDIEYEWYKMKATDKVKIDGKYTNEADGGNSVSNSADPKYISSIICTID